MDEKNNILLEVEDLRASFFTRRGIVKAVWLSAPHFIKIARDQSLMSISSLLLLFRYVAMLQITLG
jgi:hypothetical protein